MKTFIRAIEVWVPSTDRSILEFGGGLYGTATRFAALSKTLCFGRGEGLPGQAWEQQRPIVLKVFEGSYFRRTAAAHAEGITCGIAVPIFAGDFLTAVLVIFCGDDESHAGAIELWGNEPGESADMALVDGYYGTTADTFEFMSRRTTFRRGSGLPGMVWESGEPVVIEDLGKSARFLRADSAVKVGINRGFAVPCPVPGEATYVLAFLSALGTPIARRFEIWKPDAEREHLHLEGGFCEQAGASPPRRRTGARARAGDDRPGADHRRAGPLERRRRQPNGWGHAAAELGLESTPGHAGARRRPPRRRGAWYF